MRFTLFLLFIAMSAISACQSVPKERKNNCACVWELPSRADNQSVGVKV